MCAAKVLYEVFHVGMVVPESLLDASRGLVARGGDMLRGRNQPSLPRCAERIKSLSVVGRGATRRLRSRWTRNCFCIYCCTGRRAATHTTVLLRYMYCTDRGTRCEYTVPLCSYCTYHNVGHTIMICRVTTGLAPPPGQSIGSDAPLY